MLQKIKSTHTQPYITFLFSYKEFICMYGQKKMIKMIYTYTSYKETWMKNEDKAELNKRKRNTKKIMKKIVTKYY